MTTICKNKTIGFGHANMLIIDKERQIVERFEPHGFIYIFDKDYFF